MRLVDRLLETPAVYGLWQAPFAGQKFAPIARRVNIRNTDRVLDVGCGPGTNRSFFRHASYVGVDVNGRYVKRSRARTGGTYIVADAGDLPLADSASFDLVLVNSLLHHLSTPQVVGLIAHLAELLSPTGRIHILELVTPERGATARFLARMDRGDYHRPRAEWESLLCTSFRPVLIENYSIDLLGVPLWHMIYFQGSAER